MELPDDGMWSFEKMHAYLCSVGQFAHISEKKIAERLRTAHTYWAHQDENAGYQELLFLSKAILGGYCQEIYPYPQTVCYFTMNNKSVCCCCGEKFWNARWSSAFVTRFFCHNPLLRELDDLESVDGALCDACARIFHACRKEETILTKLSTALSNAALPARIKANAATWKRLRFDPRRRDLN